MNAPLTRLAADALLALRRPDLPGGMNTTEVRLPAKRDVHAALFSHMLQETQNERTIRMASQAARSPVHPPAMGRPTRSPRKPRNSQGKKRRNCWTEEQESALLKAMKDAGTDWAAIIRCHGRGGSVDDSLKDRDKASLYNKALHLKKKLLSQGRKIPPCLEGISARGRKRSSQFDPDEEYADEAAVEEPAPRRKRRTVRSAPTEAEARVEPEAIMISDGEGEEYKAKVEGGKVKGKDAAPGKSPKSELNAAKAENVDDEDFEMKDLELQHQLQTAVSEEATAKREEAIAKQGRMELERKILELKRQRRSKAQTQ